MITTILFDLDGLAIVKHTFFSIHFAEENGLDYEKMEPFFKNEFQLCLTGKADLKIELEKQLQLWGSTISAEEYMHQWFAFESTLHQPYLDYVSKLRAKGVACYIQTRNEKYRAEYLWNTVGLKNYFDGMFASPHLGFAKPDLQFWEAINAQLEYPNKGSVMVWDDKQENVDSAHEFGYEAHLYTTYESFLKEMKPLFS